MSFSEDQARSFVTPLTGRTTTFLLEDRLANLRFAQVLVPLLNQVGSACAVFDLDALYSSNSDVIFRLLDSPIARDSAILVPEPGAPLEEELPKLFDAPQNVLIIDSLNSLYHLISGEDGSSRSRKLAFAMASLSFFAKTNGRAVIISAYRREGPSWRGAS